MVFTRAMSVYGQKLLIASAPYAESFGISSRIKITVDLRRCQLSLTFFLGEIVLMCMP